MNIFLIAYCRDALTMAAAADPRSFLEAQTQDMSKAYDPAYLDIVRTVAAHFAAQKDSKLDKLLASLPKAHPDYIDAVLDGTLKGLPKYREFKSDDAAAADLKAIFLKMPAAGKSKVIRLAKAMNVAGFDKQLGEIAADLMKTLADEKQSEESRLAAARQMLDLQPDDAKLAAEGARSDHAALDARFRRRHSRCAERNRRRPGRCCWNACRASRRKRARRLCASCLSRPESTRQFLDAVEKGKMTLERIAARSEAGAGGPSGCDNRRPGQGAFGEGGRIAQRRSAEGRRGVSAAHRHERER